ncbi:hypothetical protein OBBRIDRAFT_660859 [Obba rivulosa]|uniref:Uncharacterized protein n=1 Tax=Obba rivulosa TaxID=1052685 RepID=A0A8E2AWR0_9APHY|nr:hypothetical protein OBBRIDRAFT_660859 [Obba rivulosa]
MFLMSSFMPLALSEVLHVVIQLGAAAQYDGHRTTAPCPQWSRLVRVFGSRYPRDSKGNVIPVPGPERAVTRPSLSLCQHEAQVDDLPANSSPSDAYDYPISVRYLWYKEAGKREAWSRVEMSP